jgi:transcription initiation factor TFIID subunit 13
MENLNAPDTLPPKNSSRGKTAVSDRIHGDIEEMMFGFGDEWPPNEEAVDFVSGLVTEYIQDLSERALQVAELRGKLDKECFMFLVRKDRRKFSRVHKLLKANEDIKKVQKVELKDDL